MLQLPDISAIYRIKNIINGKIYIGSAINVRVRKNRHWADLRKGIHHSRHLQRAWNKYGEDSFIFEIIEEVQPANLLTREQYYLDLNESYDPKNGYNTGLTAGSSLGIKRSDEFKKKLRKANLGRTHSKERIKSNRIAQTGLHVGKNNSTARTFILKSPEGKEHTIVGGLAAFAKEYKLGHNSLTNLTLGRRPEYKGWTLVYASPSNYSRNLETLHNSV